VQDVARTLESLNNEAQEDKVDAPIKQQHAKIALVATTACL
jgi:hypothetical protein